MNDDDDIVKEFLVESFENLNRLDRDLVVLEKSPKDGEILASVFRTIHTIKGTCGFLGFSRLGAVAHAGESVLGRLRDGQLALDTEITTALLAMVDALRQILGSIEATGAEGDGDDRVLIARLTLLQKAKPIVCNGAESGGEFAASAAGKTSSSDRAEGDSTIRLEVSLLDRLMNLAGELVQARNQIVQCADRSHDRSADRSESRNWQAAAQRLDLITAELQGAVMKTRMQPIGKIWSKLPRMVRDLAIDRGKRVRVEMGGEETELDKTLIEAMKDPLIHLARNAVDHGIESPEIRRAAGKNPEGLLSLRAFHAGGQVNLEIGDDGAGLDEEQIRKKALETGLITAGQASHMTDREIGKLILLPGFSTAEKLTTVSGRGVGMDVVRTHVERIGGAVEVYSKPGKGVMVRIRIPLTLAIISALIVTCAGERYAIPRASLLELVGVDEVDGPASQGIENIQGAPVYRFRERLLPLVRLRSALRQEEAKQNAESTGAGVHGSVRASIVVLDAGGQQFGLVVDEINDMEEIVVKPLSEQLRDISIYAGAAVLGDGKVALILDVIGLVRCSNFHAGEEEKGRVHETDLTVLLRRGEQREPAEILTGGLNGYGIDG